MNMERNGTFYEHAVIGGLMYAPEHWPQVAAIVRVDDFHDPVCRDLYKVMGDLAISGEPPSYSALVRRLEETHRLHQFGGRSALSTYMARSPSDSSTISSAKTVHVHGLKRRWESGFADAAAELDRGGIPAAILRVSSLLEEEIDLEWEDPKPLTPKLPEFPLEALPRSIRRWVSAEAESMQVPPDLPAMLALSAVSAALAKKYEVRVHATWHEPLNIYAIVALPPGEGKSPVFRHALKPLTTYERECRVERAKANEEAAKACNELEAKLKALKRKAAKADDPSVHTEEIEQLQEQIQERHPQRAVRIMANDATAEALVDLMRAHGGRMAVLSAEGGEIFGMMRGRYSSSAASLDVYLKSHAGDYLAIDRITREGCVIHRPILTLGLAVQEDVIRGLASDPSFRGRGLLARFLYSLPESRVGTRVPDPPAMDIDAVRAYSSMLEGLLRMEGRMDGDEFDPQPIPLSSEAYAILVAIKQELEPRIHPERGDLADMADWVAKLPGQIIRLAGLIHAADVAGSGSSWSTDDLTDEISARSMQRAVEIGLYLLDHARAAFDLMGVDEDRALMRYVLARLPRKPCVTQREIWRETRGRVKTGEHLGQILRRLEEAGYLRSFKWDVTPGTKRTTVYVVHPSGIARSP